MTQSRRTALVLASSSGLGLAAAKALYRDGHNVVITGRSQKLRYAEEELKNMHRNAEILAIHADITVIDDLEHVVRKCEQHFGKIDILFSNGPGPKPGTLQEFELSDFQNAHQDLLLPVVYLTKRLIPTMVAQKWGRIIVNTSITAKEPSAHLLLSNVYRAALISFAKSLAIELAADNITVNSVGPAAFKTERAMELLQEISRRQGCSADELEQKNTANLPMKRYNDPMEFGNIIAFLASDSSSAITGSFLAADGGVSRGLF